METYEEQEKHRKILEDKFREILKPGVFTKEQLDERINRGIEILSNMVDNDI